VSGAVTTFLGTLVRARWEAAGQGADTLAGLFVALRPQGLQTYVLGVIDGGGFLQSVEDTQNPWWDIDADADGASPHAIPVLNGQPYEVVFVRHPSPSLARAVTRALNGDPLRAAMEALHGPLEAVAMTVTPSLAGGHCVAVVPTEPGLFYPHGHKHFDRWLLYPQMPLAGLDEVRRAVTSLRALLGALSYPVGIQEAPYVVAEGEGLRPTMEAFDLPLASALRAFQEDASLGKAFQVAKRDDAPGRRAWERLWGAPCTAAKLTRFEGATVDRPTAEALIAWQNERLRKPGALLLGVPTQLGGDSVWVREEVAVRVVLWRTLARVFAVPTGLKSAHAFRAMGGMKSGGGTALMSLHKSGLAIDLATTSDPGPHGELPFAAPTPSWHIVYEGELFPNGKVLDDTVMERLRRARSEAAAAANDASTRVALARTSAERAAAEKQRLGAQGRENAATRKLDEAERMRRTGRDRKLLWRIYGPSTIDVYGRDRGASLRDLRERLDGLVVAYTQDLAALAGPLEAPLPEAVEAGLALASGARTALLSALDADPDAFCDGLFRANVQRWRYDPFSPRAGAPGDRVGPGEVEEGARSFVNLTRLGERAGLVRIGANEDARSDSRFAAQNTSVEIKDGKSARTVVAFLVRLRERDASAELTVTRKRSSFARRLVELDLRALATWLRTLAAVEANASNKQDLQRARLRAAATLLTVTFAAETAAFEAGARRLLDALKGPLAEAKFLMVSAGDDVPSVVRGQVGRIEQGAALRAHLMEAQAAFATQTAELVAGAARKARNSTGKHAYRWSATLQLVTEAQAPSSCPAFVAFAPGDVVTFATHGTGQALEWWHFQLARGSVGRTWRELVQEIGYHAEPLFSWHDGKSKELARCRNALALPLRTDVEGGFNQRRQGYVDGGRDVMIAGLPAGNGDALRRRLFFVIFYNNPASDHDGAFRRAAFTRVEAMKQEVGFDPSVDLFLVRVATTELQFVKVWRDVLRACDEARARVYGGVTMFHASARGDETGLEFLGGTLNQQEIEALEKLPWASGARLHVVGCNTGAAGDELPPGVQAARQWVPAQVFARAQRVTTLGEAGYAYFSLEPDRYVPNDGRSEVLYLGAFARRRNLGWSPLVLDDGVDAPRIPPTMYPAQGGAQSGR